MAINYAYYQPNGEKAPVEGRKDTKEDQVIAARRAVFEQMRNPQDNGIQGIDTSVLATSEVPVFQPPTQTTGEEPSINEFGEIIRDSGEEPVQPGIKCR